MVPKRRTRKKTQDLNPQKLTTKNFCHNCSWCWIANRGPEHHWAHAAAFLGQTSRCQALGSSSSSRRNMLRTIASSRWLSRLQTLLHQICRMHMAVRELAMLHGRAFVAFQDVCLLSCGLESAQPCLEGNCWGLQFKDLTIHQTVFDRIYGVKIVKW